jgi:hypothetical protein
LPKKRDRAQPETVLMNTNSNVLKQQSTPARKIPTQPLMKTIGRGDMPRVPLATPEVISVIKHGAKPATPLGWNGTLWHDGAD